MGGSEAPKLHLRQSGETLQPGRVSRKSKASYFIQTGSGAWGPVPWDMLREWLGLKWISAEMQVQESGSNDALPAKEIPRLWTIADRPFVAKDDSGQMASGKVAMTPARQVVVDELQHFFPCNRRRYRAAKLKHRRAAQCSFSSGIDLLLTATSGDLLPTG